MHTCQGLVTIFYPKHFLLNKSCSKFWKHILPSSQRNYLRQGAASVLHDLVLKFRPFWSSVLQQSGVEGVGGWRKLMRWERGVARCYKEWGGLWWRRADPPVGGRGAAHTCGTRATPVNPLERHLKPTCTAAPPEPPSAKPFYWVPLKVLWSKLTGSEWHLQDHKISILLCEWNLHRQIYPKKHQHCNIILLAIFGG